MRSAGPTAASWVLLAIAVSSNQCEGAVFRSAMQAIKRTLFDDSVAADSAIDETAASQLRSDSLDGDSASENNNHNFVLNLKENHFFPVASTAASHSPGIDSASQNRDSTNTDDADVKQIADVLPASEQRPSARKPKAPEPAFRWVASANGKQSSIYPSVVPTLKVLQPKREAHEISDELKMHPFSIEVQLKLKVIEICIFDGKDLDYAIQKGIVSSNGTPEKRVNENSASKTVRKFKQIDCEFQ